MAKRITHSNYTIKKVHKKLSGDKVIYERDYAVTYNGGSWDSGSIPFGTQSFKMVSNYKSNTSKKHKYGEWLKQNECIGESNDSGNKWTLNCLSNIKTESSENTVEIKPNHNSLLDFAYYGSCVELIKSSIQKIIANFPAEMQVTDSVVRYIDIHDNQMKNINKDGEDLFLIDNPFGIDIVKRGFFHLEDNDLNLLRYFCESQSRYEIRDNDDNFVSCIDSWIVKDILNASCATDGDLIKEIIINDDFHIFYIMVNGKRELFTTKDKCGFKICLVNEEKELFFRNLDDFEKIMLNRNTQPIYTMSLDYPHETEYGIETYIKTFSWPTKGGWNLDIKSQQYAAYVNELLTLANFYDERQSDNLWRAMTHDAIKNMDLTFQKGNSTDEHSDYALGTSKLRGLFTAYGRQFDEIKRLIDNIKSTNKITYDENNNLPDYFLSDSLEIAGWEPITVYPEIENNESVGKLYSGDIKNYSSSDANNVFMKALKINSKAIFSHKGTRSGIDMILGLFGLKSYDFVKNYYEYNGKEDEKDKIEEEYDYKINEYVVVADNIGQNIDDIKTFNSYKISYSNNSEWGDTDTLQGLPVREVEYIDADGNLINYLIPWFSKVDEIDGKPYFQMYGGWGKMFRKDINIKLPIENEKTKDFTEIVTDGKNIIYDETIKCLNLVRTKSDLYNISQDDLSDNEVFYVSQIGSDDETNYFILKNKDNSYKSEGWENIKYKDINEGSKNEKCFRILYLESILDNHKGNNPHGGYGKYDDGQEFINQFKQLFKYSIEHDNFKDIAYDCNGKLNNDILNSGFNISDLVIDNVKTWYFTDIHDNNTKLTKIEEVTEDGVIKYIDSGLQEYVKVGKEAEDINFNSELIPYNFEGEVNYDEAAANSIINIKKLVIEFNKKFNIETGFYEYVNRCVLPYLKQMIPSTTILEIKLNETPKTEWQCLASPTIGGITD